MNVARVTLAHGSTESQLALIAAIRTEADAAGKPICILADLPGPKVRTTPFESGAHLERNAVVTLVGGDGEPSTGSRLVIDYPSLVEDLEAGDVIVVGDGAVQLRVDSKTSTSLSATVTNGGVLSGRKGVRIPAGRYRASVPTAHDLELIDALRESPVDILAVSFVRSAADMAAVRAAAGAKPPWLMAKIETAAAVENLTEIIHASDAVMVARGDLGTELPIEEIPHLQKRIIRETVRHGKPVVVATQMLESMIESPTPTRAEATDVANAVLDNTSAVMLSAETAVGRDPVAVVQTMVRLLCRAEEELDPAHLYRFAFEGRDFSDVNLATAHAGWQAAHDLHAVAILCCTRTGSTARKMASLRPSMPLYGLTTDRRALRQLSVCWGVQAVYQPEASTSTEGVMRDAVAMAQAHALVKPGDIVVVLAGSPEAGPGHTDSVRVAVIGSPAAPA
jgi:pyruvate kinase